MQMIFDKVVLSRAWASLPPQLQIFRLGESSGTVIYFAKYSSYFFIRNAFLKFSVSSIKLFNINLNNFVHLELGVFAKKPIPKRTQFGPYIADMVTSRDDIDSEQFFLQVLINIFVNTFFTVYCLIPDWIRNKRKNYYNEFG